MVRLAGLVARRAASTASRFLRTVPTFSGLPEMQTFECRPCHLAVTAEQVLQFSELLSPLPG